MKPRKSEITVHGVGVRFPTTLAMVNAIVSLNEFIWLVIILAIISGYIGIVGDKRMAQKVKPSDVADLFLESLVGSRKKNNLHHELKGNEKYKGILVSVIIKFDNRHSIYKLKDNSYIRIK